MKRASTGTTTQRSGRESLLNTRRQQTSIEPIHVPVFETFAFPKGFLGTHQIYFGRL
jgi:hypothetical protein